MSDIARDEHYCPTCGGSGYEDATDMGERVKEACSTCEGDGKVVPSATYQGAVEENERLREIIARASRLAETERAELVQQVLGEAGTE